MTILMMILVFMVVMIMTTNLMMMMMILFMVMRMIFQWWSWWWWWWWWVVTCSMESTLLGKEQTSSWFAKVTSIWRWWSWFWWNGDSCVFLHCFFFYYLTKISCLSYTIAYGMKVATLSGGWPVLTSLPAPSFWLYNAYSFKWILFHSHVIMIIGNALIIFFTWRIFAESRASSLSVSS